MAVFEQHIVDKLAGQETAIGQIQDAAIFLKRLRRQYDVVFATGSLLKPALIKLQQAGIIHPEALIVASNDYSSREEIVSKAIELAKEHYGRAGYEQIVSFGDGLWDYKTAQNLGLDFIGIRNEALKAAGAAHFFPHFADKALYALLGLEWPDEQLPDFAVEAVGPVSNAFISADAHTFGEAVRLIKMLPYGRNTNKEDLVSVFTERRRTCGTKHALLKQLAIENNYPDLQLVMGIFRMHERNTPAVANTLRQRGLAFMPEAHNYLRYHGRIIDCTFAGAGIPNLEDEILIETEIQPSQIGAFKVAYHKAYLAEWLRINSHVRFSLEELWTIRERCIEDLSAIPATAHEH